MIILGSGYFPDFGSHNKTNINKIHMSAKQILKKILPKKIIELRSLYSNTRPIAQRKCPVCGFQGWFRFFGKPPRLDAQCPECESLERHRLFYLETKKGLVGDGGQLQEPIIHFAPEIVLSKLFRKKFNDYKTADFFASADLKLNLEKINLENSTIGTVIANHVLEHVNDEMALGEVYRILKPGGLLITSTIIIEAWEQTYENKDIVTEKDREVHFGQRDHLRYYGRDFKDRVMKAGFKLKHEIISEGQDVIDFGLIRGEKIFVFEK